MHKNARIALALACAASLFAFAGCASKKQNPATSEDFFAVYDADGNGEVTEEEFVAKFKDKDKAHKQFKLFDPENDGRIQRSAASILENNSSVWSQVDMDDSTAQEP